MIDFDIRTYLPIKIHGSQVRILPIYVNVLGKHLSWINNAKLQPLILEEMCVKVLENIEEFEKQSRAESKAFCHIGSGKHTTIVYTTKYHQNSSTLLLNMKSDTANVVSHSPFSVNLWIFPLDAKKEDIVLLFEDQ
jgi:hypothetical protein